MAITKLGATIVGIRGTIGGIIYSANKSGTYAKIWTKPPNQRSIEQVTQRGHIAAMPELWRALTPAEKSAWDTFAALPAQALINSLGVTYYISGFGWFVKCNTRLLVMGRSTITATPTIARPAAPTIDIIHYDDTYPGFYVRVRFRFLTDLNNDLVLFTRAIPASGRSVVHSRWYNLANRQGPQAPIQDLFLQAAHLAEYGEADDGWQLFVSGHEQTPEGLRGPADTDNKTYPYP